MTQSAGVWRAELSGCLALPEHQWASATRVTIHESCKVVYKEGSSFQPKPEEQRVEVEGGKSVGDGRHLDSAGGRKSWVLDLFSSEGH